MASTNAPKQRRGVIVPMITPLTESGELDEKAARRVVDHLLAGGVDAIFVIGTTGESASLPAAWRPRLVAATVEQVGGRTGVYAGISSNCLSESLAAGKEYLRMGVDALVVHLPCYFPLSDQEQYHYFKTLLDGLAGPLVIYNIPQTTGMSISLEVVEQLAEHPNAAGLKDSAGDPARLSKLLQLLSGRDKFPVFVGTTALAAEGLKGGAAGYVPSIGNLTPSPCRDLYASAQAGRWDEVKEAPGLARHPGEGLLRRADDRTVRRGTEGTDERGGPVRADCPSTAANVRQAAEAGTDGRFEKRRTISGGTD